MIATTSEDLLDLVPTDSPNEGQPTPAQQALMNRLVAELRELDPVTGDQAMDYMRKMIGHWTPGREGNASRWINRLIAKISELWKVQPTVAIEDGMYVLDGQIFKVQHAVHGSGRQYAKRFVPPATKGEKATFEYAAGVVRQLQPEHRMSIEQAREYGALYGTCIRCGLTLTREDSIERMMGKTCASKI